MLHPSSIGRLKQLIICAGVANDELSRWYLQGFQFCIYPTFGLRQHHGGPCGILAVVQAEMLRAICLKSNEDQFSIPNLSKNEVMVVFANALCKILLRCIDSDEDSIGKITLVKCICLMLEVLISCE